METYFSFKYDGELFDLDCTSREEVVEYVEAWWREEGSPDAYLDYGYIVEFYVLPDGFRELTAERYYLEMDSYHGDYVEHNIWHKGGVL